MILLRRNGFLLRLIIVIKCKDLMTLNLGFIIHTFTRETTKDYTAIQWTHSLVLYLDIFK